MMKCFPNKLRCSSRTNIERNKRTAYTSMQSAEESGESDDIHERLSWRTRRTAPPSRTLMHFAYAVFCALLRASVVAHNADVHPLLEEHGSTSSALRIRLLPPAIRYFNEVGAYILAKQLPRILIPNINHRLANDQGFISLSRVRVSRFKRASTHNISTSGPNKLTWVMRNLNIGYALFQFRV